MINRRPRQSTDPGHQADAAASQRLRLQSDKAPEALFIQNRGQLPIPLSCGACLSRSNHSETLCREIPPWESRSTNSSRSVVIMTQLFMDEPLGVKLEINAICTLVIGLIAVVIVVASLTSKLSSSRGESPRHCSSRHCVRISPHPRSGRRPCSA